MSAALELLADLMETFVRGGDRSMVLVDRIEGLLIQRFQDSELYEELSPAVASYRPGGGDHLFDEEALAAEFRYALQRLLGDVSLHPQGRPCGRPPQAAALGRQSRSLNH